VVTETTSTNFSGHTFSAAVKLFLCFTVHHIVRRQTDSKDKASCRPDEAIMSCMASPSSHELL